MARGAGQGRPSVTPNYGLVRVVAVLACTMIAVGALGHTTAAKIGDPVARFASSPLIQQLQLTFGGQQALTAPGARVLHRYTSDDGLITVDLVVRGGVIEQQVMYVPADARRAHQVGFFLQDALGSIVASQRGLLAFRAAVTNRATTGFRWGDVNVRYTPLPNSNLQVLVWK